MPDNYLIIFLSPKTIDRGVFSRSPEPVKWIYLGKQFHEKVRIERELGPSFLCMDIAHIHNDVADTIRQEFVEWIDELNRLNGSSREWWWGSISSRNVYRSNIFQYCCYIEILDTLWKNTSCRPAFVVVESPALAEVIQRWGTDREVSITFRGRGRASVLHLKDYGSFFLQWLHFIAVTSLRKCAAMVLLRKHPGAYRGKKPCVLVHTYIHPASLSENGIFSDRYFPYLYDFLEENGKHISVLPTYHGFRYNFFPLFGRINKTTTDFIIPEQYLTISDLLCAFAYPIHLLRQKNQYPSFRTKDCSEILREDTIQDKFGGLLEAILVYRLTGRLKNAGIMPERCIDWYENQATSRALSAGFRTHFPGVPLVGAQIFLHYPNFLSLSPTVSEVDALMVPNRLLVTSRYQCLMATMFAPDLDCRPCAALRYSQIFKKHGDAADSHPPGKKTVLLLASFDLDETLELISQVRSIIGNLSSDVRVQIKLHPDMEEETIVRQFGSEGWPENILIFSGTLFEALEYASLVISKSSGSIVEAATQGIPVIFLGNQTKLNINPLAGIDLPVISECYTTGELEISIQKHLTLTGENKEECRKNGDYLRDLFFTDINAMTLAPFLE